METIFNGFRPDYVTELGKQYLVLDRPDFKRQELIAYQIEMIARNSIPGVAPLEIREKDLQIKLYYPLQGYMSLTNYLRRQKISKANFIDLVDKLLNTLTGSKKFFLLEHAFIFSEDYVYVDARNLDLRLIYLPVESTIVRQTTANHNVVVKDFLMHLVIDFAQIETQDNFVQRFLQLVKQKDLSLEELRRELYNLNSPDAATKISNRSTPAISNAATNAADITDTTDKTYTTNKTDKPNGTNVTNQTNTTDITNTTNTTNTINAHSAHITSQSGQIGALAGNGRSISAAHAVTVSKAVDLGAIGNTKGNRLRGSIAQQVSVAGLNTRKLVLYILAVISVGGAILSTVEDLPGFLVTNAEGLVYLLLAGILAVGLFLRKGSKQSTPEVVNKPTRQPELRTEPTVPGKVNLFTFELDGSAAVTVPQVIRAFEEVAVSDETEILAGGNYPMLKAVVGSETIIITKPGFTLGRNQEICDYALQNHGVGRLHAQVKQLEGVHYLTDLDSRNGTFINGERLVSNKPYEIKHQDRIAIANAEYLFWVKVEEKLC